MKFVSIALAMVIASPAMAQAAGFEVLKPHRAVYDVKLQDAEDRSGIAGMSGRIVYEVKGNECEGISVDYRFVTRITTGQSVFVTDQQTSTHESPDGEEFSFQTKSFVNEQPDQKVIGNAKRLANGLKVHLGQKEKRELDLEEAIFTTTHLVKILDAARSGTAFIRHDVFDGSGDADKVLSSASVIGRSKKLPDLFENESDEAVKPLLAEDAWPITMSYFNKDVGASGESVPIYEASFFLYGNGITRQLQMRYPDYSLLATLTELEYFDAPPCQLKN